MVYSYRPFFSSKCRGFIHRYPLHLTYGDGMVVLYVLQVQAHSNAWTRGNPRRVLPFIVFLLRDLMLLVESRLHYLRTLAKEKRIARVPTVRFLGESGEEGPGRNR